MLEKPQRTRIAVGIVLAAALAGAIYYATRDRSGGDAKVTDGSTSPERSTTGGGAAAGDEGNPARAAGGGGARGGAVGDPVEIEYGISVVVEGRVLDAHSGAPQAGVDVTLVAARGPGMEYIATSGADGLYHAEVTTGRWDVSARGDGIWSQPTRLVVAAKAADAVVVHDVLVHRAGIVRGRVLRRGQAVAGAEVAYESRDAAVRDLLDASSGRSITADGGGRFELQVPPGEAQLRAESGGAVGFVTIPAVAPGTTVEIDIPIADPATVAGRVIGADGAPVGGATVTAVVKPGEHRAEMVADGGRFELSLPPGRVTLEARLAGGGTSGPVHVDVAEGASVEDVTLSLAAPVGLSGVVVDVDGTPVGNARVKVVLEGSRSPLALLTTGDDGRFDVPDAIAGTYEVLATLGNSASARRAVSVGDQPATVELVLASDGGIRGVAHSDQPLRGLRVAIERYVSAGMDRAITPRVTSASFAGAGGEFSLPGLQPGTYDLLVTATGRAPGRVANVVVGDGTWTDVEVDLGGGGRLSGTVTEGGAPITGARVSVDGEARVGYTDGAGKFSFDAVALGPVTLTVADDRHPAANRSAVVDAAGTDVTIELSAGAERDVEGIGVVLDQRDDRVEVIAVRKGPATGQVPVGAAITAVDGTPIASMNAALARIRGPVGTEVTLTLAHQGRTWEVTLVRARVTIHSARSTAA